MDLHDAVRYGDLELVQVLVNQGADKNKTGGHWGWTPLYAASLNKHVNVVRYLALQGADMEKTHISS